MKKPRLKFTKLDVDKRIVNIAMLAILFILIFLSSIVARAYFFDNNSLPGKEAHFNTNIAKDLLSLKKNFVVEEKALQELIWPAIIAIFSFILRIPVEFSVVLLSLIFGILSLILIYFIVERLGFKKKNMALVFFLISPATIWLFSTSSKFIFPFSLSLLTLYLLLLRKTHWAFLTLAIVSLFGVVSSISALTLTVLSFKKGWLKDWFWKAFFLALGINIVLYWLFPFFGLISLEAGDIFGLFFSLSKFGVSLFAFLIACIGIFITWKERKERKELSLIYLVFGLLFIFSVISKEFIFFFNFILIFLAVIGFVKLLEREWASSLIRNLALGILIIGLIFPLIFMPLRISSLDPDKAIIDSLEFLRDERDGAVLSANENGYWIKSFSGNEAFVDEFKSNVRPELNERAIGLLKERNLEKLREEFGKEGIRYVLLDSKTREIFRTEEEGILLLLKQEDIFNQIYDRDGIGIWEFLGRE